MLRYRPISLLYLCWRKEFEMRILRLWMILLLALMLTVQARAQADSLALEAETLDTDAELGDEALQVRVKGFLDTYHAVRTEGKADWMASRTRARGELTLEKGAASLFLSLNATYNSILRHRSGLELREAFLSYAKGGFDLRLGRQIVVWGVADALPITDCVSPFDYTEFLAQDYDDIRIPVNALRLKYTWKSMTFEAIYIPVSDFYILSTDENNPWSLRLPSSILPLKINLDSGKPEKRLCNAEYGGKVSVNLRGIDFSVSALRTWNKMPALAPRFSTDGKSLNLDGHYHRMTMLGADCSIPFGQLVLRSEGACYLGEAQGGALGHDIVQRNSLNTLIGLDWFPGNDWNVSVQYHHKYIYGNPEGLSGYQNSGLATARVSKDLFRNTLKLSTFAYIDVTNRGVFNRLSVAYSLSDQIELTAGYDFFHAEQGKFAMYGHNFEIWAKVKYSF